MHSCEVCGSSDLATVLRLGNHAMCDDLVPVDQEVQCIKYPIDIIFCRCCFTAHQAHNIPKATLFPSSYHYRSRLTKDVIDGMHNLVQSLTTSFNLSPDSKVLDIGCNDGSLLNIFAAKNCVTIGVEPTSAYKDIDKDKHFAYNNFFDAKQASQILSEHGKVDFIVFTNVFAHIENLPALLDALSTIMHDNTLLVVENHYLGSVLDLNQFDTFYHEHPRTYSFKSFEFIARSLSREICNVELTKRYGGNIRVTIGPKHLIVDHAALLSNLELLEPTFESQFIKMNSNIESWKTSMSTQIHDLVLKYGPLAAKAFPGRASLLLELLGLQSDSISCIYEQPSSPKIGHFAPGTNIPIKSDEDLFESISDVPVIINLAWHIGDEIKTYLRQHGFGGSILNIM